MELVNTYKPYTVQRKLPVNYHKLDKHPFDHELSRAFEGFRIVKIRSVWLDSGGMVAGKYGLIKTASLSNLRISPDETLKRLKQSVKIHLKKKSGNIQKAIWISERWSHSYFHWFCDALTRYFILPDERKDYTLVLPAHYAKQPYIIESLKYFNIEHTFIKRGQRFFVEKLLMAEPTCKTGNYHPEAIKRLHKALQSPARSDEPTTRLYISRNKARIRQLINENECLPVLAKYGFTEVYLEDLSFAEQMKFMSMAETIIGVHGAGLTNILACQEGTRVIEIRGENDNSNNCFFSLASELNAPYYYLKAKENPTSEDRVGNVTLDPIQLEALLSQICKLH